MHFARPLTRKTKHLMDIDVIREYCLARPHVEEGLPFGPDVIVFKVSGKIFLLLPLDSSSLQFNVKCDPDKAEELRATYPAVLPGYHMNKKHWNTIKVDGSVPLKLVKEWIDDSYNLVAGKTKSPKKKK